MNETRRPHNTWWSKCVSEIWAVTSVPKSRGWSVVSGPSSSAAYSSSPPFLPWPNPCFYTRLKMKMVNIFFHCFHQHLITTPWLIKNTKWTAKKYQTSKQWTNSNPLSPVSPTTEFSNLYIAQIIWCSFYSFHQWTTSGKTRLDKVGCHTAFSASSTAEYSTKEWSYKKIIKIVQLISYYTSQSYCSMINF